MSKYRYQVSVVLVCLGMILSVSVVRALLVPVPSTIYPDLSPTATQPYVLEVPFGESDFYVGLYSNGSVYAVNCSTWDRYVVGSDASTVISAAVGYAAVGHGSVFVESGDYAIASQVTGDFNNTKVWSNGARLYLPDDQAHDAAKFRIFYVENCENFSISGFVLDGNYVNNDYTATDQLNLLMVRNSRHFVLEDNVVINSRVNGIWIGVRGAAEKCYDFQVLNNRVLECKWNGINCYVETEGGMVYDGLIHGNYVRGSNDIGIDLAAWEDVASSPCRIEVSGNVVDCYTTATTEGSGNDFYGIRTEGSRDCLYLDNVISSAKYGIADNPSWGVIGNNTYSGNIVWCNGTSAFAGMQFESERNVISDNKVYSGFASGTICINVVGKYNVVEDNYLYNIRGGANVYGVAFNAAANYTVVMGNMFMTSFEYPLDDKHMDNCVFEHNYDVTTAAVVSAP